MPIIVMSNMPNPAVTYKEKLMPKTVPTVLVVILLAITIILLLLGYNFPQNAYWPNLASNALFLLVGIFIVDQLLSRHERSRWIESDSRFAKRIATFAAIELGALRVSLNFHITRLLDNAELLRAAPHIDGPLFERYSERFVPEINNLLRSPTPEALTTLAQSLQHISEEIDKLLALRGHRLDPILVDTMLKVHADSMEAYAPLRVFHELCSSAANREDLWDAVSMQVVTGIKSLCEDLIELGTSQAKVVRATG
jgi:hypothetical protein